MSLLQTHTPSRIDVWRDGRLSLVKQLLLVLAFSFLMVPAAKLKISAWEIPFTLQTVVVYSSGLFLGWPNAFLSQIIYVLAGLVLPVFAGEGFGLSYLFRGLSGGYVLAFPVAAALIGWLSHRWNSFAGSLLSLLAGSLMIFGFGIIGLYRNMSQSSPWHIFWVGWIKFIPLDLAKILLSASLYHFFRAAFGVQSKSTIKNAP